MALQDLTPQLRTRLSRLERVVGLFVTLAVALFLVGFVYYAYKTGQRRGLFLTKMPYFTYVDDAAGLKVGDKVMLMGFEVGEITEISPMDPFFNYNVFVAFEVREPYYGYLWNDSRAAVAPANLLGARVIEVTKGTNAYPIPTYMNFELRTMTIPEAESLPPSNSWVFNDTVHAEDGSNLLVRVFQPVTAEVVRRLRAMNYEAVHVMNREIQTPRMSAIFVDQLGRYTNYTADTLGYMLPPDESPALTERAEQVVRLVENTLPNLLDLTNKIVQVLTNVSSLTARAEGLLTDVYPAATNVVAITSVLRNPDGSLGQWLFSSNMLQQFQTTLQSAQTTVQRADGAVLSAQTNMAMLTSNLVVNLENLAGITSNLNAQVQGNSFILSDVSELVRATDELVQGLKRHWLLKGSFTEPKEEPDARSILEPSIGSPP